jgi:histone H3/H4
MLKVNGKGMKISPKATEALRYVTETYADEVARQGARLAAYAGRKTILASDIEMVTS